MHNRHALLTSFLQLAPKIIRKLYPLTNANFPAASKAGKFINNNK